jgi:hypothetical protein
MMNLKVSKDDLNIILDAIRDKQVSLNSLKNRMEKMKNLSKFQLDVLENVEQRIEKIDKVLSAIKEQKSELEIR